MKVFALLFPLVALLDSVAGLHFHEGADWSFAEFRGWAMPKRSELQFYFKTGASKPAILLYQDNRMKGTENNDFLEISLIRDGHVQLYLRGNQCSAEKRTFRRNFTDNTWHLVTIERNGLLLDFGVDNITAKTISCMAPPRLSGFDGKAINFLYIGGIPFFDSKGSNVLKEWSLTGLFQKVAQENSWFQGCIALVRYSTEAKRFRNARLLRYEGISKNCSGEACSNAEQNMCQNGRCVDLVVRAECDCEKTGYYGRFCEQKGSSHVNRTVFNGTDITGQKNNTSDDDNNVSSGGDVNESNEDNDNVNDPDESPKGVTVGKSKKAQNAVSPLLVSPPVCLFLYVAALLMRHDVA